MRIEKLESSESLGPLKQLYMGDTTAPLDGMWLFGFVPQADHYGLYEGESCVGFACVNEEAHLLQFFLDREHQGRSAAVFKSLLRGDEGSRLPVVGAFVSTAEPHYLSLCLDHFATFEVNALMYQRDLSSAAQPTSEARERWPLVAMGAADKLELVALAAESTGAPEGWLSWYYSGLLARGEVFGVREGERLIALGENRRDDAVQVECADLGVIVAPSARGEGLATHVLRWMAAVNDDRGLRSICSTERDNIAAQKAIARAGFFAYHRILRFSREG